MLVENVKRDPESEATKAGLSPRERALVAFAVRLTRSPETSRKEHLDALRAHGLTDEDLFILVHVIGYFNHINRVADALGVELEKDMPEDPRSLSAG